MKLYRQIRQVKSRSPRNMSSFAHKWVLVKLLQLILANHLFRERPLRPIAELLDSYYYRKTVEKNRRCYPRKVQEDKYFMLRNMLRAVERGIEDGLISRKYGANFLKSFGKMLLRNREKMMKFAEEHGSAPPMFLTVSPTKTCNLRCVGCYAASSGKNREHLDYDTFSRIIRQQKELWGSHFTVISGGEPLLYRDRGKTIFDIFQEHRDTFFLMYTNGTLITREVAEKFAELGNVTPAISVEGFEAETDARRGRGVHRKILQAFDNLRRAGVIFGISITANRDNAEVVMSDEFIDYYFNREKALYGWIFHYMPIGRNFTTELMMTPEQRLEMYKKTWKLIREDGLFLADFWNCGTVSNGCISGGRGGGYLYIDWNGDVMPCVFIPYKSGNINQVYARGGDLNDILFNSFFAGIRKWQDEYALKQPAHRMGNFLAPCAIRDHYDMMFQLLKTTSAEPAGEEAAQALNDPDYRRTMVRFGKRLQELTEDIWQREYIEPELK